MRYSSLEKDDVSAGKLRLYYEYTAESGRHDHATFGPGSGPTRQSDDRDSEPDYLLRPTRHGPGGTLLDYSAFRFRAPNSWRILRWKKMTFPLENSGYIIVKSAVNVIKFKFNEGMISSTFLKASI